MVRSCGMLMVAALAFGVAGCGADDGGGGSGGSGTGGAPDGGGGTGGEAAGGGGIQFYYNQAFPLTGLTYLSLQASAPAPVPLELKLMDAEGGECAPVSFTADSALSRVEVDLATACAGVASVRFVQLQLMQAEAGDFVLDDIVFE